MLSMLREATKGWTAKILLVLLVASFAVWGVSGSILQGAGNSVVTVGETTVTPLEYRLAHDRQLNALQQQLGSRLTREQAEAFGLSSSVLSQLVSGALLDESARRLGLGMSDDRLAEAIGDDPAFRDATGRFSRTQLQAVLRSIGMPEAQYVETRRNVALRNQMIEGTTGKLDLPQAYWDQLSAYQAQERKFNYVVISQDDIAPVAAPDDTELEEYYEANKADYVAPEYRKLNIVKLEAADIADPSAVSQEDIEAEYEARKDSFSQAEKRTIEQLVFSDREKAQAALDMLATGKSFEELVTDQGRTLADISLGTLAKSEIPDPAIAEAAFDLETGVASQLVEGTFGPVLLRVTEIQPGSTRPLSEVEAEIRQALAVTSASEDLFDVYDQLEDERAAGETLEAAARSVGLDTRVIEAIDRTARDPDGNLITDIPQSREVLAEAFEVDEGTETDPVTIGSDGFVWYEVAGIVEERQKPLDEVRDQVREDWIASERQKAVEGLAEAVRSRVAGGESFNAVIGELLPPAPAPAPAPSEEDGEATDTTDTAISQPRIVQQSIPLIRTGSTPELPQAAVVAGFGIPEGAAIIADGANGNDRIVLSVAEILTGNPQPLTDQQKQAINTASVDDIVSQLVTRLQNDLEVEINQQAINAALNY